MSYERDVIIYKRWLKQLTDDLEKYGRELDDDYILNIDDDLCSTIEALLETVQMMIDELYDNK